MFKRGQVLTQPIDFDNAMLFGIPVEVRQKGEIIDYGGTITKNADEAVYINDGYYFKATCQFVIR